MPNPNVTIDPAVDAASADPATGVEPDAGATPEGGVPTPKDVAAAAASAESSFRPILSQADFDKAIGPRIGAIERKYADYDELAAKAKQFDELERAKLSDLEQRDQTIADLQAQLEQFKADMAERELNDLRAKIARDKGLPEAAASRLTGTTQEELEADADAFLELMPKQPTRVATPTPEPVGGGAPPVPGENTKVSAKAVVDGVMRAGLY